MFRGTLVALFAMTAAAATVDTTLLGTANGPFQPLVTGDGQGNVLVVTNQSCSILQECQPISIVKLDASGKVLLRKGLGDSSWRLQVNAIAMDRVGNMILAGGTADPNLPLVRPLRSKPEGGSDAYLMQLSPDGSRILFATYLGGNGIDVWLSVEVDGAGNVAAAIQTNSTDFPTTALPPSGAPRLAILRILTSSARLAYAMSVPIVGPPGTLSVAEDGTVVTLTSLPVPFFQGPPASLLEIRPDGTARTVPVSLPLEAQIQRAIPAGGGGFWVAGYSSGALPVTANAWQPGLANFSYIRWEGAQRITPPGPIRGLTVRVLEVDRAEGNRVYAATSRGLARTEDNGWTWELINETAPLRAIQALATGAGRLWVVTAGVSGPALYFSEDRGNTFQPLPLPAGVPVLPVFAVHPTDPQVLYLAFNTTLFATRTGGETWTQRNFAERISLLAANAESIALVTETPGGRTSPPMTTIHWSENAGESFRSSGPTAGFVPSLLKFDPFEPGRLYLQSFGVLSRTTREQFPEREELARASLPIVRFDFHPELPGVLLGVDASGRGQRSDDGGRSWQALSTSLATPQFALQLAVGAGGVMHLVTPVLPEAFLGKMFGSGEISYLTYLGVRPTGPLGLTSMVNGQVAVTGSLDGSVTFPGQVLRGSNNLAPPGTNTGIDVFAVAFTADTRPLYAVSLAGIGPDNLRWAGAGGGSSLLLFGVTYSPDFPGIPPPGSIQFGGPTLFLSRLVP